MGLKVLQTTGEQRPLTIVDQFKVQVKHLTRHEYERLEDLCKGKQPEEVAAIRSRAFIGGWSDFTPAAARRIGIALDDAQTLDATGCIPFDADNARDAWLTAHTGIFSVKIEIFSLRMLEAIEAEKEAAKNGFGGLSPTSTTR